MVCRLGSNPLVMHSLRQHKFHGKVILILASNSYASVFLAFFLFLIYSDISAGHLSYPFSLAVINMMNLQSSKLTEVSSIAFVALPLSEVFALWTKKLKKWSQGEKSREKGSLILPFLTAKCIWAAWDHSEFIIN